MQEWLARAASQLDLQVCIDFSVPLADGRTLRSQAHFPDLGGDKGTLIFTFQQDLDAVARRELKNHGYALSTFSEPLDNESFDIQSYASMFREWGWTGALGAKPRFMR
jgi:hypothetical protein